MGKKDEVEVLPCHSLGLWEPKVKRIQPRSMVGSSFCGPEPWNWNSGEELSSKELKLSESERWWMEPSSPGKRGQFSSRKEDSPVNLGLGLSFSGSDETHCACCYGRSPCGMGGNHDNHFL